MLMRFFVLLFGKNSGNICHVSLLFEGRDKVAEYKISEKAC